MMPVPRFRVFVIGVKGVIEVKGVKDKCLAGCLPLGCCIGLIGLIRHIQKASLYEGQGDKQCSACQYDKIEHQPGIVQPVVA